MTAVALCLVTAGCATASGGTSGPAAPVPGAVALSDALITPADLPGQADVHGHGTRGGIVELCGAAPPEARQAAAALEFDAGVRLGLQTEPGSAGSVYVAQYLVADAPEAVASTFAALQSGAEACDGESMVPEEGFGAVAAFDLPAVGDARFGERHALAADPEGSGMFLHMAVVRQGSVLMVLNVYEFTDEGPQVTATDVAPIVTAAVDKLP